MNFDEELAQKYDVMTVPTLIIFQNGEEKARRTGADRKNVIEEWIADTIK